MTFTAVLSQAAALVPMIEYLHPRRLWWIAAVVAIGLAYLALNARTSARVKARKSRVNLVLPRDSALKRHLSVLASLLAMTSLIVAWATPQDVKEVPRERATVALVIDISLSMKATDVQPTRIEAVQQAAIEFLDMLPKQFNVSLVLFGGDVPTKTVPTTDRAAIKTAIQRISLIPATAIGEGIYAALDTIDLAPPDPKNPDKPAPAAIVLLSDGSTNAGRPSEMAAQEAAERGVPVNTIAYGTPNGHYIDENGRRNPVPVNHAELQRVAQISGGEKFSAESLSDLRTVYESLAKSLGREEIYVEVTERYAGYALLLALLASLGVVSLAARWP